MIKYPSAITFLYYNDYAYGISFMKDVLGLNSVMDQGFAQVFQVNNSCYIGIVKLRSQVSTPGNTLISLNSNHLNEEYERIKVLDVKRLQPIKFIKRIPLRSFFFHDKEGHRFEIQQFVNDNDKKQFHT